MLKRIFTAAAFAAVPLAAGPAFAADAVGSAYSYNAPVAAGPHDWSGNYVGGQVGATSGGGFPSPFASRTKALGGIVAGKNMQSGNIVFGAEVEGNFGEAEYKIHRGGRLQQSWNLNAKGKVGYAVNNTLLYGTAGYGVARFKAQSARTDGPGWQGGFLLGAGVEQVISGPISVKAEYDFQRFNDAHSEVGGISQSDDLKSNSIKAGVNYHF